MAGSLQRYVYWILPASTLLGAVVGLSLRFEPSVCVTEPVPASLHEPACAPPPNDSRAQFARCFVERVLAPYAPERSSTLAATEPAPNPAEFCGANCLTDFIETYSGRPQLCFAPDTPE